MPITFLHRALSLVLPLVLLLLSSLPLSAQLSSVPNPSTWVTDSQVLCSVTNGSKIYIGGHFTYVGPNTGKGVPIDTTSAQPVAAFPKVQDGIVYVAIPDGSGGWYIGGSFTKVGSSTRNAVAHITPAGALDATWDPNLSRTAGSSTVYALALSGTTLYVGGDFTHVGATERNCIAALRTDDTGTPTAWAPNANNVVRALALKDGTVYAGGDFTAIGGQIRRYLAAINGAGAATTWDPDLNNVVYALTQSADTLYVGGSFTTVTGGGTARNRFAAYQFSDGALTALDPNFDSRVECLALYGTTLYAGGRFTHLGDPFPGGADRSYLCAFSTTTGLADGFQPAANGWVYAVAVSADGNTVYAGGQFDQIGADLPRAFRRYLAALNASDGTQQAWFPIPTSPVRALFLSGSTIYVGGEFYSIAGVMRNKLASLDATTGAATTWDPSPDQPINALLLDGTTLYVAGGFTNFGASDNRAAVASFDTTTGNLNPAINTSISESGGIGALALSGTTLYVGGAFSEIGGQSRNNIAALNTANGTATAWDPNAGATGYVNALLLNGTTLYAGGAFTSIGGQPRNYIAALDTTANTNNATAWNPNANNQVYALALGGTTLYAGGYFTSIGGQSRNFLAALDTTVNTNNARAAWNPNATGDYVRALALSGNNLYVGGAFTNIGGQAREGLACVNSDASVACSATSWNPNNAAGFWTDSLSVTSNRLFAGGSYASFGGNVQVGFAQFDGTTLVEMASFTAKSFRAGIRLEWSTSSEMDNAGFHVWRAEHATGPFERLTVNLIPSKADSQMGSTYHFEDRAVEPSRVYFYKLEDLDRSGQNRLHGPVSAKSFLPFLEDAR